MDERNCFAKQVKLAVEAAPLSSISPKTCASLRSFLTMESEESNLMAITANNSAPDFGLPSAPIQADFSPLRTIESKCRIRFKNIESRGEWLEELEARAGIEPAHKGFADLFPNP